MPTPSAPPPRIAQRRDQAKKDPVRRRAFAERPPEGEVALRMSIAREGIGLELARPTFVGCLRVTELASTFAGVRFPVNVSGGVTRFRHRRARLERFELELGSRALERWVAPRLRDAGWQQTPDVWAAFDSAEKATLCVSTAPRTDDDRIRSAPAVAFDLHVLVDRDDMTLVVSNARGVDLPAPATAVAVACVEAAIGRSATRSGTTFRIHRYVAMLARELLPQAGARVPAAEGVEGSLRLVDHDTWLVRARREALPAAPKDSTLRAREAAALTNEADDALVSGDLATARSAYLAALERAPRHPEIARRIVEIDVWTTGRAEAALEMIAEIGLANTEGLGILRGELQQEAGDVEGALVSFEQAAASEPAPAVAALVYERAARSTTDAERACRWLDEALARAPRAASARWGRVRARLALGRVRDALGDVEHLDAMAPGAAAKSVIWLCAGRTWRTFGFHGQARALFERALRFVPDNPDALAGLAAALLAEGAATRGVALLTRALSMASDRDSSPAIRLELARALAEHLHDLPAAVAHASAIPADAALAPIARGLEGRWRACLGDTAGASLAYSRLRELAESLSRDVEPGGRPGLSHVASAVDGSSTPGEIANLLREAAQWELSKRLDAIPEAQDAGGTPSSPALPPLDDLNPAASEEVAAADIERSAHAEDLSRRLQLDPTDDGVADELALLLEELGRGHELLALLLARLDDAGPQRREALAPRIRTTLARLAAAAEAKGRTDEAALYHGAAAALGESK